MILARKKKKKNQRSAFLLQHYPIWVLEETFLPNIVFHACCKQHYSRYQLAGSLFQLIRELTLSRLYKNQAMSLQVLFHCISTKSSWSPDTHKCTKMQFLHTQPCLVLLGHTRRICCWDHMLKFKLDSSEHRHASHLRSELQHYKTEH